MGGISGSATLPMRCKLVGHLLLLEVQLGIVAQVLPLAAPAGAEVLAERRHAQLRILVELGGHGLQEVLLGLGHAQVHHVAGGYLGHEDDQILDGAPGTCPRPPCR